MAESYADLYIDALAVSVRSRPRLQPSTELPRKNAHRLVADMIARECGVPAERMCVPRLVTGDPENAADCATTRRALEALGPRDTGQTLFLVRSGPVTDPMASLLAGAVHAVGWAGDDVGITHLREQGGTQVFRLLSWVIPEDRGATVVIVDDPAYVDSQTEKPAYAAVAIGTARQGALRIAACGENPPGAQATPLDGRARTFSGAGACDAWLDLYAALSSGAVGPGESVLLRTVGTEQEGWLLLEAARPHELRTASAPVEE